MSKTEFENIKIGQQTLIKFNSQGTHEETSYWLKELWRLYVYLSFDWTETKNRRKKPQRFFKRKRPFNDFWYCLSDEFKISETKYSENIAKFFLAKKVINNAFSRYWIHTTTGNTSKISRNCHISGKKQSLHFT